MSGALDLLFLKAVHDGGQGSPRATLRRRVRLTTSPAAPCVPGIPHQGGHFPLLVAHRNNDRAGSPGAQHRDKFFSKLRVFQGVYQSEVSVKGTASLRFELIEMRQKPARDCLGML